METTYKPGQTNNLGESLLGTRYNTPVTSSFSSTAPTPSINAPIKITPEAMTGTTPIVPPAIKTSTASAPIIATTNQSTVDYAKAQENAQKIRDAAGTAGQDAQAELTRMAGDLFGQKSTIQGNQVDLENQAGLQEQKKILGEINNQIANEQVAMRAEEDRVRNGFGTEQQKQVSINTINDTYGRRLADFAIRQAAAQGNITAIQADAERQTKLLTAPLDTKIQYLQSFGQKYADTLRDDQKEKLALITQDITSQKKAIEDLQQAKSQMIQEIASNGGGMDQATIEAVQRATDLAGVSIAGAKYVGALDRQLKQAQLSKIWLDMAATKAQMISDENGYSGLSYEDNARLNSTPEAKAINDGSRFATALIEYKNAIDKYGTGEVFGQGSGTINSAYQEVVGRIKDYYQLGTLDDGVQKLVELGIPKPSVWGQKSARTAALDTQISSVLNDMDSNADQLSKTKFAKSVEGQGIIQKAKVLKEQNQKDPLGLGIVANQNSNTTSTDPLGLNFK